MNNVINVIDRVQYLCTQQGLNLEKIFNDGTTYLVHTSFKDDDSDDLFYLFSNNKLELFDPAENNEMFNNIRKEDNVIYE